MASLACGWTGAAVASTEVGWELVVAATVVVAVGNSAVALGRIAAVAGSGVRAKAVAVATIAVESCGSAVEALLGLAGGAEVALAPLGEPQADISKPAARQTEMTWARDFMDGKITPGRSTPPAWP